MANDRASSPRPGDPRANPEFEPLLTQYIEQLNLKGFVDPEQVVGPSPRNLMTANLARF